MYAKHDTGRDLHVVAKLKVTTKADGLRSTDESVGFEEDVGNGASREHAASNQLMHNLSWDLLIRDGHEHSQRNGKNCG